jgi:hypothetical protein
VPASSARKITQKHANSVFEAEKTQINVPSFAGVEKLVAQIDGSMIPIVETTDFEFEGKILDRRKTRSCSWREARLCLAHAHDCEQLTFGATLGTVDEAGEKLVSSAIRAGMGIDTHVHGLGDGATWIATQFKRVFASQATYLIDFYHLCDYLAAASERCASKNPQLWRKQQKQYLKTNQVDSVLAAMISPISNLILYPMISLLYVLVIAIFSIVLDNLIIKLQLMLIYQLDRVRLRALTATSFKSG